MLPENPETFEMKMTLPTVTRITETCQQQQQGPPDQTPNECPTQQQETSPLLVHLKQLSVENIMPGIYLTKNFTVWSESNLRSHGFTHIIIIDKHIQELNDGCGKELKLPKATIITDEYDDHRFDYTYSTSFGCTLRSPPSLSTKSKYGNEFEVIDLNFGEKSYLTTVLPNCYRAVKFIDKALQTGGTTLVIDCNGGEQKCLTIIAAYLMYKDNINFCDAFNRLKGFYKKADLDRFYVSQLYEYEPILQVQRAHARGHSCSRELHAAILKRKKLHEDHRNFSNNCNSLTIGGTNVDFINSHYHHSPYKTTRNSSFNSCDDYVME